MKRYKTRAEQKKDAEIESGFQAIETQLDSASQRLAFLYGRDNAEIKKVTLAMRIIRRLQSKYYPVKTRSIKRSIDSVDENGHYKPELSKQNWRKFKKLQDIKKGKQKVIG